MAAVHCLVDANKGISKASGLSRVDNVMNRAARGGAQASLFTPLGLPVIREWEYAEARTIVFTCINSCLGAIQIDRVKRLVRGAHFSMYVSDNAYDPVLFSLAMRNAGFLHGAAIFYFGGSVADWRTGLGATPAPLWLSAPPLISPPGNEESERKWIFDMTGGILTCHSFA